MKPQKKGFCNNSILIPQLRAVSSRFMKFCDTYTDFFQVHRKNVSEKAHTYLSGLLMKAPRKNMERMDEYVNGCNYEACQQFLSDSTWDHIKLNKKISFDVNSILGGANSILCLDESCFSKKGKLSVGTKRQWNGRLGKIDNCQVGVYTSLCNGEMSSLVDFRLFLPEEWANDEERCNKAKIPNEYRVYKTKLTLGLEMIDSAIENKLNFSWVAADAFYGRDFGLLKAINERKLKFVADIPKKHHVYLSDPKPYMPRRRNKIGPKHKRLKSRVESISVSDLFEQENTNAWRSVKVRNTTKGTLNLKASRQRVYVWDGESKETQEWWLIFTYDKKSQERKYFLSNAPHYESLITIVRKHASRFWIERTFQDGKTSVGMADYQARGWLAWHHHMTMVMLALLFLLKERILNQKQLDLLSCQDVVELLDYYLPRKDRTEKAVLTNMLKRHERRRNSIKSAYFKEQKQNPILTK